MMVLVGQEGGDEAIYVLVGIDSGREGAELSMGALREPYHAQGSRFAHLETECGTKLNSPSPKKRVLRTRGRSI